MALGGNIQSRTEDKYQQNQDCQCDWLSHPYFFIIWQNIENVEQFMYLESVVSAGDGIILNVIPHILSTKSAFAV